MIGKRIPRVDAYERVSGTAVYPSDLVLPQMLYGAILRCPHPHAMVKGVDISKARKMPGVHAVISGFTPGWQSRLEIFQFHQNRVCHPDL